MLTIPLLFTFSILFTQILHPLAMGLILLIQSFNFSYSSNFILFILIFLYFILSLLGGMLVLFIYMASLASHESFYF